MTVISCSADAIRGRSSCLYNNVLQLKMFLALLTVALVICKTSQSSMFDQCGPRHTNLTQECVGKFILETLAKVTEDPENFFGSNVSILPVNIVGTFNKYRRALCNEYISLMPLIVRFLNDKKLINI